MQTYFAVLAIEGFDRLKRQAGYPRAVALLDDIVAHIAELSPDFSDVRANRATVEFCFRRRSRASALTLVHRLRESLRGAIILREGSFARTVTIAAVRCRGAGVCEITVQLADRLLAQAQLKGDPILVSDCADDMADDHRLMEDLHAAIEGDRLELHYQPKLRARHGELAGVEALVRWRDPVRGQVPPNVFIPLAERSGDIRPLTEWVIDKAIADQKQLQEVGIRTPIHVNLSAALATDARFIGDILERLGPCAESIGLEITETAMMSDPEATLVNLQRLADAGISLSIDDYGSGFSSLAYLQRLPVKELKIDQMFISRLSSGSRDPLLVRSTIDLAHALEMEVTAEGVESPAVLALLQVMGCDLVQGYLLSRPVPLWGLIDYVRGLQAGAALPRPVSLAERASRRRSSGSIQP